MDMPIGSMFDTEYEGGTITVRITGDDGHEYATEYVRGGIWGAAPFATLFVGHMTDVDYRTNRFTCDAVATETRSYCDLPTGHGGRWHRTGEQAWRYSEGNLTTIGWDHRTDATGGA